MHYKRYFKIGPYAYLVTLGCDILSFWYRTEFCFLYFIQKFNISIHNCDRAAIVLFMTTFTYSIFYNFFLTFSLLLLELIRYKVWSQDPCFFSKCLGSFSNTIYWIILYYQFEKLNFFIDLCPLLGFLFWCTAFLSVLMLLPHYFH